MNQVVVLNSFRRAMKKILTQQNEEVLISFLSTNPLAGDVIVGTGGMRKLRDGTLEKIKAREAGQE